MSLNIIGISAFFHDSACCLLRDGELVCAAEEERFSRRKHDPGLPWRAFRYCLEEGGISVADVDCIAYYEDPTEKLSRQIWMRLYQDATGGPPPRLPADFHLGRVERAIRSGLGWSGRLEIVGHHEAHAASSFHFSGFDDAAILTVDGVGEWTTTAFGRGAGREVELFETVDFPHSLGLLYSALTAYLGFKVNSGEYKVMGLAPYGEPRLADRVRALLEMGEGGQFRLNLRYFDFLGGERMFSDQMVKLFGEPPRAPESAVGQFHKDLASSLQLVLEEVLLEKIRYLHNQVPSENLCMAGGVALNCVANGRLLREGPFSRLFVQPAAGDSGGALGAAAVAHVRRTGERPCTGPCEQVYLGPGYRSEEIADLLAASSARALDYRGRTDELLTATAERLAAGQVIGWFHGRMEFGPRALGARSILADPRDGGMRDRINALVKKRESFRPFAPAVLVERTGEHFELDHPSPFMLETCQVDSPLSLPAITHVNGSARVQTVDRRVSPRFAALLDRFAELTGCPILLNTSFNMRGEPIVCTPADAIACFVRSNLDALVLEDFLIEREAVPESWREFLGPLPAGGDQVVSGDVYTLL